MKARVRWIAALAAAFCIAACGPIGAPGRQPPLDPSAQRAAAEKLARGFAEACLTASDATGATAALRAQGWPPFIVVWDHPDSVFYAAKPSPASPAGLFVIEDHRAAASAVRGITCIGHYAAEDSAPMVQALERPWGASRARPANLPASRSWAFRLANGVRLYASIADGAGGPATAAALAALRPDEALVYAQVSYNAPLGDVASLVSVRRRIP